MLDPSRPPASKLPAVALGSTLILVVERAVALFAAWMLIVVVLVRALEGELPREISGRGLRYADAEATQGAAKTSQLALAALQTEVEDLRRAFGEQLAR